MRLWPRRTCNQPGPERTFAHITGRITVTPATFTDHDYIRDHIIPEVVEHLAKGENHYGPDNHRELGLPGQYADIWRKIKPLKRALWDGDTAGFKESPREICLDLIGHCLLTIAMLDRTDLLNGMPIITGPTQGEAPNKLRAAGWTEMDGIWSPPLKGQPKGSCDECWGLTFHRDTCSQSGPRAS